VCLESSCGIGTRRDENWKLLRVQEAAVYRAAASRDHFDGRDLYEDGMRCRKQDD